MPREMVPVPDYYNSLEGSLAESWRLLARGAADRRHGFHHPTIATLGLDGRPRARTVILRAIDVTNRRIVFHTDRRAEKIPELAKDPRIAGHFYDEGAKLQLRLEGRAKLHLGDDYARTRWEASQTMSRVCYSIMPGPGIVIETGHDYAMSDGETISRADQEPDFTNFAAIEIIVEQLEWLYLASAGHRRAQFSWGDEGAIRQSWLVP